MVRVLDGLTIANGPAFTADGTTMYLADTGVGTILRCRIDPLSGGLLGSPEPFTRRRDGEGSPDGMTVDAEGCLWVALWGAGVVRRYHPDGRLLHTLAVPAPHPTSVCLAPDDNRLFVRLFLAGAPLTLTTWVNGDKLSPLTQTGAACAHT